MKRRHVSIIPLMLLLFSCSNPLFTGLSLPLNVKFNLNYPGAVDVPPAQSLEKGSKVASPTDPVRTGYVFAGWYQDQATTVPWDFSVDVVTHLMTLYAKWISVSTTPYTVSFNLNYTGATGTPSSQMVASGGKVTQPTPPTRATYSFGGWFREAAGTTAWSFATDTVTASITLYAKWSHASTTTYTVAFNLNYSGASGAPGNQTVTSGGKVTQPTPPSRTSYYFGGWFREATGTTVWNFATDTVTVSITLYAKWSPVSTTTYTVNFDLNYSGASGVPGNQTVVSGGLVTQPATPTRSNYSFGGWFRDAAGTTAWNFASDTVAAAMTLYAKWNTLVPGSSVTQYGITWTFDQAYQTGQFANGDYWVVGPVTIIGISPGSTVLSSGRVVSGSMINPKPSWNQGYDSDIYSGKYEPQYVPALNAGRPNGQTLSPSNPLVISQPASLVTGVSYTNHPAGEANQVHLMAVLTVLASVPPAGAFRPPFTGTDKTIRHTTADLDYTRLPTLAVPSGVSPPNLASTSADFQKLWPDHMLNWYKEPFLPKDNMPNYGRDVANLVGDGALLLVLGPNTSDKQLLALRMVQIGLDIHGLVKQPDGDILYTANGGHSCGRAFPMVLSGYLLHDQAILDVMAKAGQYAYQNGHYEGNLPSDMVQFQELDQTFYVTSRDVARTNGPSWNPDTRTPTTRYTNADIGLADWGITHAVTPEADNASWQANYRSLNSYAWSGFVLAARIMGMKDLFNQPALFDYMDRWMSTGYALSGESRSLSEFQDQMWTRVRSTY